MNQEKEARKGLLHLMMTTWFFYFNPIVSTSSLCFLLEEIAAGQSFCLLLPRVPFLTVRTYTKLISFSKKYIYFPDAVLYTLCAIFVILTYLFDIFDVVPYLDIFGVRGSGKTRLGKEILGGLCLDPIKPDNISDAAIYRAISEKKELTTLILDEADDALSDPRRLIVIILRAGNRRGATILRTGRFGETESFAIFCPKIIISIKGIGDWPLETRTIPIHMIKTDHRLEKFRFKNVEQELADLKDLIRTFSTSYRDLVLDRYLSFQGVEGISEREEEVWTSLFIIADLLPEAPSIKNEIIELAKKTILERRRNEVLGNRDLQILISTRDFLENVNPLNGGLYVAEELRDFIKKSWGITGLTTEAVSRVLNRNGIIKEFKRPNLTPKGGSGEKVQKTCYIFNKEILWKLTDEYF